ncbi:MAG TPA: Mur ligase family protein, partial [Acidimicrobiales bacterium]|nr:Mur ligase family protein [Acidimicrobiales bacterium]
TLDAMRELVHLMGNPERTYPAVHITGTNAKGSTAAMVTSLLGAMGLAVGTYTSPDLQRVNERMALDLEPIPDEALAEQLGAVRRLEELVGDRLLRFEILTAAAFRWFADEAVDVAVVEVGMGGLWDATNVADADVAVVTNVSLDHVEVLGPGLADIAAEKAGIVKPGCVLVLGETDPELAPVFREAGAATVHERDRDFGCVSSRLAHGGRLLELRTPLAEYPDTYLPLHGAHQADNAACALAAAEAFFAAPLAAEVVCEALASATNPGRMEPVGRCPLVLLDGAHNPAGARAAAATLSEEFAGADRVVVVMGLLAEKDPVQMLSALGPERIRQLVACPPPSPRALDPNRLAGAAARLGVPAQTAACPGEALERALALADPAELVLVCGSLYLVGEARTLLCGPGPAS